jgi:Zn finger protein HypA/HybF involved in hydrogenase expression
MKLLFYGEFKKETIMEKAKIIKKTLTLSFCCTEGGSEHTIKLTDFQFGEGYYFTDYKYDYVSFKCPLCKNYHEFEICM